MIIVARLSLDVYEILIDLTETSSGSRQHGAEKSGSTALFMFHSIGVDYESSALFEKHRMSTANYCSKSALFSVRWSCHSKSALSQLEFMVIHCVKDQVPAH